MLPTPEKSARQVPFDATTNAGTVSGATPHKASNNIVRHFQNAQAEQEKEIMESIAGNLELQMVVKACIKEYKENVELAETRGQSLGDLVADTVRQRKRKRGAADAPDDEDAKGAEGAEEEEDDAPTDQLRRGQYIFGQWTKKLLDEVLAYLDKKAMGPQVLKVLTLETKKECLEFGVNVKCFGDELDRVGTNQKGDLYPALKRVYVQNGCPFNHLVVDMDTGVVDWGECAPWKITAQTSGPATCTVTLAAWANSGQELQVKMDDRNFLGDSGPFTLEFPFSLRQAAVKSEETGDTFTLMTLVPQLKRRVLRRPSDEGAANLARKTFQQSKQELKEKRAAAKRTAGGMRKLGGTSAPSVAPAGAAAAPPKSPPAAAAAPHGGGGSSASSGPAVPIGASVPKNASPPLPPPQAALAEAPPAKQDEDEEEEAPPPPPPAH